MQNFVHIT